MSGKPAPKVPSSPTHLQAAPLPAPLGGMYLQAPAPTPREFIWAWGEPPALCATSGVSTSSSHCVLVCGQQYIRPKPLPSNYARLCRAWLSCSQHALITHLVGPQALGALGQLQFQER